ncbi:MAG: exodeoxyribonuclease I [Nitrosomonas sp.]|nr:exodeoxyribonuclease I [Nitrosomonas sp.]
MPTSLYWHDYETTGSDPKCDRPVQFAGVRTDESLQEISEPLVIYCTPPRDRLPQPEACLLTGITPQFADAHGLIEFEFITKIHQELAQPNTCGVGYNSLRFDDEVTRFTLYRNFYDPYAREWQQGNSRWDLIDVVRMTYALRPNGIVWPINEAGSPSFRLEDLTRSNHLVHDSAHDALSDVRATIQLARLIRNQQPRLYNWLFELKDKYKVAPLLNLQDHTPIIHTSRMYPAEIGCTTLAMSILQDPKNSNSILVYDLRYDPSFFLHMTIDELSTHLFTPRTALPENSIRLPIKAVRMNKCPAIAPKSALDDASIKRIKLDLPACDQYWKIIKEDKTNFMEKIVKAYSRTAFEEATDVELALYDNFFSSNDQNLIKKVRGTSPTELNNKLFHFSDKRLPELLFRFRARNWPETLSTEELQHWKIHCYNYLTNKSNPNNLTISEYNETIAILRGAYQENRVASEMLDNIEAWGKNLIREAQQRTPSCNE